MKTKFLFSLTAIACCIISCNRNNEGEHLIGGRDVALLGMAAHAHDLLAMVGEVQRASCEMTVVTDGDVSADKFALSVITCDSLDTEGVTKFYETPKKVPINESVSQSANRNPIPEVEKALVEYEDYINKTRTVLHSIQYRLEGVTAFSITADKEYAGRAVGGELGDYFQLVRYAPSIIFNYETYELSVYDEWRTDDIADWLAMKPLAQPGMTLMLKEEALCAASDIAFTITMTLTDGRVLKSTTPVVSIVE